MSEDPLQEILNKFNENIYLKKKVKELEHNYKAVLSRFDEINNVKIKYKNQVKALTEQIKNTEEYKKFYNDCYYLFNRVEHLNIPDKRHLNRYFKHVTADLLIRNNINIHKLKGISDSELLKIRGLGSAMLSDIRQGVRLINLKS